jgi:hypothetical protein
MIVKEAQELQEQGKTGLKVLPGVLDMLSVVRLTFSLKRDQVGACEWALPWRVLHDSY